MVLVGVSRDRDLRAVVDGVRRGAILIRREGAASFFFLLFCSRSGLGASVYAVGLASLVLFCHKGLNTQRLGPDFPSPKRNHGDQWVVSKAQYRCASSLQQTRVRFLAKFHAHAGVLDRVFCCQDGLAVGGEGKPGWRSWTRRMSCEQRPACGSGSLV